MVEHLQVSVVLAWDLVLTLGYQVCQVLQVVHLQVAS